MIDAIASVAVMLVLVTQVLLNVRTYYTVSASSRSQVSELFVEVFGESS